MAGRVMGVSPAGQCWTGISPLSGLPLACTSAWRAACSAVPGGRCLRRPSSPPAGGRFSVWLARRLSALRLFGTQADAGSVIFHTWRPGQSRVSPSHPPTEGNHTDAAFAEGARLGCRSVGHGRLQGRLVGPGRPEMNLGAN